MRIRSVKTLPGRVYEAICQRPFGFYNDTLTITPQSLAYKGAKVRLAVVK